MSQKFYSEVTLEALNNATTDTDHFLVGDSGTIKYRTGTQLLSDLGINPGVAHTVSNEVKAGVAINKGQAVYVTSADGTNIIVGLASNASEATSSKTLGLLDATVATNGFANVVEIGRLSGLNTLGATAGDPVWLGVNGNLIYGLANKPYAPAHLVFIGIVTRVNSSDGEIFVNVQNGFELKEIHDVDIITNVPINGDVLGYDGTLWVNKTIAEWLGYTPANANGTTNYVSKFTSATTLGNSQIFDNGTSVGIGTASPSAKLDIRAQGALSSDLTFVVKNSADTVKLIEANGAGGIDIRSTPGNRLTLSNTVETNFDITDTGGHSKRFFVRNSDKTLAIYNNDAGQQRTQLRLVTGAAASSDRLSLLEAGGNVGIGTSSPSYKLTVRNDIPASTSLDQASIGLYNNSDGGSSIYFSNTVNGQSKISFGVESTGAGTNDTYLGFSTGANASLSERMRIDSSGNILVGQTSPIYSATNRANLTIGKSAGSIIVLGTSTAANGYLFYNNTDIELANSTSSGSVFFRTSGTERMRITSSGNVGIGTTSPLSPLDVQTNGSALGINIRNRSGDDFSNIIFSQNNGSTYNAGIGWANSRLRMMTGGVGDAYERFTITSSGNVGIGTASPSGRLQVASATAGDDQIWLQSATYTGGYSTLGYNANTGEFRIKQNDGGSAGITFYTGASASEKMRITPSGNVGIGTTSPAQKLDVDGDALINRLTVGRGPGGIGTNTVFGRGALDSNTSGENNIAIGYAANSAVNISGSTVIGTDLYTDPGLNSLTSNCLAISQYNPDNSGTQYPHIYAPDKINCPNGNTTTDVLAVDYSIYTAVFMEYSIFNSAGDQFRAGTFTVAFKSTGSTVEDDNQTVVYSGTTLSATFIVSVSGSVATIQLRNQDSDTYDIRVTARLLMR